MQGPPVSVQDQEISCCRAASTAGLERLTGYAKLEPNNMDQKVQGGPQKLLISSGPGAPF